MELLIKSFEEILDKKISLLKRGIIISIALSKDNDPRITLAKFKLTCNIKDIKQELVELHESSLIKWSGYKNAKKSIENSSSNKDVVDCMEFFNSTCKRNFSTTSKSTTSSLVSRLKEHSVEDIKLVIANRYEAWNGNEVMEKHLTPSTIFRPKNFEKYLEEAKRTRVGESFVAAEVVGLKNGDLITSEIAETFVDNNIYNIRIYNCDENGNKRGNGILSTRRGKAIKRSLKLQKLNPIVEHLYFYVEK